MLLLHHMRTGSDSLPFQIYPDQICDRLFILRNQYFYHILFLSLVDTPYCPTGLYHICILWEREKEMQKNRLFFMFRPVLLHLIRDFGHLYYTIS